MFIWQKYHSAIDERQEIIWQLNHLATRPFGKFSNGKSAIWEIGNWLIVIRQLSISNLPFGKSLFRKLSNPKNGHLEIEYTAKKYYLIHEIGSGLGSHLSQSGPSKTVVDGPAR